jgi:hypothetical protein
MVHFDHFEIHVTNSEKYVSFLQVLFKGGRFKKISENNTYMFLTPEAIHIEVKENKMFMNNFNIESGKGLCLPCLRMNNAELHINSINEIEITNIIQNPDGKCYFFKDYEKIDWHIKDYMKLDMFVNI